MMSPSHWKTTQGYIETIGSWAKRKGFDVISDDAHFVAQLLTLGEDTDDKAVIVAVSELIKRVRRVPPKDQLPEIAHIERFLALATEARARESTRPPRGARPSAPVGMGR